MLGVEGLGLVVLGLAGHDVVPPDVTGVVPRHLLARALYDKNLAHTGTLGQRVVNRCFEGTRRAPSVAAVRCDHVVGVTVEYAAPQGVGGEAAEDDGVRGAEAGAGQHGDHCLGDHRHVDRDLVAGAHAELGQCVRRPADIGEEVGVGDGAGVAGLALPVECHPLAEARLDVPVDAVDGDVELAADEPLGEGLVPLEDLRPSLGPREAPGLVLPERERVRVGLGVDAGLRVGGLGQVLRRGEDPGLVQKGRQPLFRALAHLRRPPLRESSHHPA